MYSTRIELIDLIKDAFKDVTREGGVSWHECEVIDNYGSDAERALARTRDTDRHWTELLSTEAFYPSGIGGFCFLDPIGFRYYLPAALCLSPEDPRYSFRHQCVRLPPAFDSGRLAG